jgi:hypothetical protein
MYESICAMTTAVSINPFTLFVGSVQRPPVPSSIQSHPLSPFHLCNTHHLPLHPPIYHPYTIHLLFPQSSILHANTPSHPTPPSSILLFLRHTRKLPLPQINLARPSDRAMYAMVYILPAHSLPTRHVASSPGQICSLMDLHTADMGCG